MARPVLLCADGSAFSTNALAAGLRLLAPGHPLVLVTVVHGPDPSQVTGTGFAGGVMSEEEYEMASRDAIVGGDSLLDDVSSRLGLEGVQKRTLGGRPGPVICALADELDAAAIVVGSRGHGGLVRAVLGSVSDHVVRNASCTVVVTGEDAASHPSD